MGSDRLTNQEFWETKYTMAGMRTKALPRIWLERADFETIQIIHQFVEHRLGARLIELGCGNSYWLPYFAARRGLKVFGLDFSAERASVTKRNLERTGATGEIRVGDFLDVPADWQESFDIVFSNGVVEHFDPTAPILGTFSQYLAPGGTMLTLVPYLQGLWGRIQGTLTPDIPKGYVAFDLDSLVAFHHSAGLNVVHAGYYRWLDPSVLNLAHLDRGLRRAIGGAFIGLNLILLLVERIARLPSRPVWFCSGMAVVAKKPGIRSARAPSVHTLELKRRQ